MTRLYLMSAEGGGRRYLGTTTNYEVAYAWAPDSNHIAATRTASCGRTAIVVIDRNGSRPRSVTKPC